LSNVLPNFADAILVVNDFGKCLVVLKIATVKLVEAFGSFNIRRCQVPKGDVTHQTASEEI
jgi:hypothetical protein